jgi:hypothetical protein
VQAEKVVQAERVPQAGLANSTVLILFSVAEAAAAVVARAAVACYGRV